MTEQVGKEIKQKRDKTQKREQRKVKNLGEIKKKK